MAEYIERSSVHALVRKLEKFQMYNYDRSHSISGVNPDDLDFEIDKIPAADVAPVRHGRWKGYTRSAYRGTDDFGDPIYRDVSIYYCSNCDRRTVVKERYCPHCGAFMDLKNEA